MSLSKVSGSRRVRRRIAVVGWFFCDAVLWFAAVYLAIWLRLDFEITHFLVAQATLVMAVAVALTHGVAASVFGAYSRVKSRGSFDEVRGLAASSAVVTFGLGLWNLSRPEIVVPRTVPLIGGLTAYSLMLAVRFAARSVREMRALNHRDKTPIIVFGAGRAGKLLVQNLVNDAESQYRPVAFLDDDRSKHRHKISGVTVHGQREHLEKVAARTGASTLVIAIPSATGPTIAAVRAHAESVGIRALVIPPLSQMVGHRLTGRDIRGIDLADLLGRRPITLDTVSIGAAINHKVVMVTGAGGSIGSELCRQLQGFNPARLVMLDRDESALQAVAIELTGDGLLERRDVILADIRDAQAVLAAFREHQPDIVFHAAALKHLPLLESYPLEAWKTNVVGTHNVLKAAADVGVQVFVNISTDKAADPTSVLGYSKRIAERLTAGAALTTPGRFLSVRFGNVLGSRGSVIPAFQAQIRRGGPVTVTDSRVERYFMLIPEACQLVMQAAAIGRDGEVMVLDMGKPVKIIELAKTLINLSGRTDIEIRFTGLRPGEKLSEDLFDHRDNERPTAHPLVSAVEVSPCQDDVSAIRVRADDLGSITGPHRGVLTLLTTYALGAAAPTTEGTVRAHTPASERALPRASDVSPRSASWRTTELDPELDATVAAAG